MHGLTATCGPVVELGPGTGVFTAALLRGGISPAQVAVIEASENFTANLARCFPQVAVIRGDAARVRCLSPFGPGGADQVLCGLPLLSIPPTKVLRIVAGWMTGLKPDGELRLFTYGQRCPIPSEILVRLGLVIQRRTFVPHPLRSMLFSERSRAHDKNS